MLKYAIRIVSFADKHPESLNYGWESGAYTFEQAEKTAKSMLVKIGFVEDQIELKPENSPNGITIAWKTDVFRVNGDFWHGGYYVECFLVPSHNRKFIREEWSR